MRGYNDAPNIPPPAPQNIAYRDVVLRIRARSPAFFDSDEVLLLLEKAANEIDRLRAELAECHFKREEAAEQFSKAYGLLIAERDECLQTIARLDEANLCMHTELATVTKERDEALQTRMVCGMCHAKIDAALAKLGADKTGE